MVSDLIYDVGKHNGSDTAYYLAKGFRVVAIEANPLLAEEARKRFASDMTSRRLVVLNVGIGPEKRAASFWVNDENSEWSSFDREVGCRDGTPCHCVNVRCMPFREVLRQYGVPYYLKVDIEGNDILCLQELTPDDTPQYVSVEAHKIEYLCILHRLGYTAFKCINQLDHNDPATQRCDNEQTRRPSRLSRRLLADRIGGWFAAVPRLRRFLRCVGILGVGRAILMPRAASINCQEGTSGWVFPNGSSGPFGEETYGEWEDLEKVAYNWLHYKFGRKDRGSLNMSGWYDFHAKKIP